MELRGSIVYWMAVACQLNFMDWARPQLGANVPGTRDSRLLIRNVLPRVPGTFLPTRHLFRTHPYGLGASPGQKVCWSVKPVVRLNPKATMEADRNVRRL